MIDKDMTLEQALAYILPSENNHGTLLLQADTLRHAHMLITNEIEAGNELIADLIENQGD